MTPKIGPTSGRVVSIDTLRGFDMFWIIGGSTLFLDLLKLWNTPSSLSLSTQFQHSEWNGFTFYDLIFPLFMFIAGTSLPYAICKRLKQGSSRKALYLHITRRTITLFFLGLIVNGLLNLNFADQRWLGVLQRIAIAYFIAAIIVINTSLKWQAITAGTLLLTYWGAMALIPVPGFGAGVLTPEGNLAAFVDQKLLHGIFCCYNYGDNEGILSTVPSISTVLLGVLSGHWLSSRRPQNTKVLGLLIAAAASLILALVWNTVFPINKYLWSSSYVLYAGAWSLLLLCLFYYVIDIRGHTKWAIPFFVIGLNALTIYVADSIFNFERITRILANGFLDWLGSFEPLLLALILLTVEWLFLYFLYRKKIFLKA